LQEQPQRQYHLAEGGALARHGTIAFIEKRLGESLTFRFEA
jgi:hypothetical protein